MKQKEKEEKEKEWKKRKIRESSWLKEICDGGDGRREICMELELSAAADPSWGWIEF